MMVNNFIIKLLFYLQLVYVATYAQYNENDARNYISEVNEKLYRYYDQISDITFGKTESEYHSQLNQLKDIANNIAELTTRAKQYPIHNYQDNELKQAIKNIQTSAYLLVLGSDYYGNITEVISQMKASSTDANICDFKNPNDCKLSYLPDARRIMTNFRANTAELLYYWNQWRNNNVNLGKTVFPKFIQLLMEAASRSGVTVLELWYHVYGREPNLIDEMEKVMTKIEPFYKKIHAYVRFELNRIYGDGVISESGSIPHHFLEVVMSQAWKKDGVLEQAFPHKKLPNLKSAMDAHGLNGFDNIIRAADQFYSSLGLNSYTHNYITAGIFKKKPKEKTSGRDCRVELYDKTPSIRVEYCSQSNFRKFLQVHGWMARIYYANQKKYLPFAFYQSYEMEQALGEAGILSASTPKHIQNIGILPDYRYTQEHLQNRLFRMGVHTWFNIPIYFVHIKVMDDLLKGHTNFNNINEHYWNLMKKYVGVERPMPATIDSFDFPYKFYEGLENNQQTTKFMSEIAGYQIYKSLCLEAGEYVAGSFQNPLHNCDIAGKNVTKLLTDMMSVGSKQPWRQVLAKVTKDENGLDGQALLDYYEPLEFWFDHNEKFYNYPVGW